MVARYATAAAAADISPSPHIPQDTRGSNPLTMTMPTKAPPSKSHCFFWTFSPMNSKANTTVNTGLKY